MADVLVTKRSKLVVAIPMLLGGVVCFVVGGALAWGRNPLVGFALGAFGIVLLEIGAVLARTAMIGRFLDGGDDR